MSKDVDSGITHYVCIHVASEVTTKAARELDPTSPVALPKLPNGMAETPTARSASHGLLSVHDMFNKCGKAGYVAVLPTGIADDFNTSMASVSCRFHIVCTLVSCYTVL